LDIQYNRNEDYKTIILPQNSYSKEKKSLDIDDAAEKLNESEQNSGSTKKPEATLLLNDDKEVETTVIFLPNIWSLMPTSIEYQKIVEAYKNFIENPPVQITKPTNNSKQSELKLQTEENLKQMEPESQEELSKLQEEDEGKVDDTDTNGPVEVNSIEELTKSLKALKFLTY